MSDDYLYESGSKQSSGGGFSNLILIVVLAAVCYFAWNRSDWGGGDKQDRDKQEEREDQKKDDESDGREVDADWSGYSFYSLVETKPLEPKTLSMLDALKVYAKANDMAGAVHYDDDLPEVKDKIDWAKSKGVSPPFTILYEDLQTPKSVISFPKTIADLEGLK